LAAPVNPIEAALRRLADDLTAAGRRWALVGGLAVSARAAPRTTLDVDIAVAVTGDADAEALVHTLQAGGYYVRAIVEQEARNRLATARLVAPAGAAPGIIVDLLFASSGIEGEVTASAETLEVVPGLQLPVATIGHLLALKTLARDDRQRPQDWDDIQALLDEASTADLALARRALDRIASCGYHRGKQLTQEFEQLVQKRRG
jgi:predicted nucleotidyltransferase